MSERSWHNRLWYAGCRNGLLILGKTLFRLRRTGLENIPATGPLVVAANHQSFLDPPMIGGASPRRLNYLARAGLFRWPPLGALISSLDAIPIDQEKGGLAGIKETLRRLKRGEGVLIFPEGARSEDGEIHPFEPGFTALAYRGKAAVVPTAIEGAFRAWPRHHKFPRLYPIHVRFGEPIQYDAYRSLPEREMLVRVEEDVRRLHAELRTHHQFRHSASSSPAEA